MSGSRWRKREASVTDVTLMGCGRIRGSSGRESFEKQREDGGIDNYYTEAEVARQILHEVLWMVPNLGLDSLMGEADRCQRSVELREAADRLDRGEGL